MKTVLKNIILTFSFVVTLFSFATIYPNHVSACCSDSACGGGGQCIDAPASNCGVQGYGEGYCISGYETCSGFLYRT